jgi:hypothetical protein
LSLVILRKESADSVEEAAKRMRTEKQKNTRNNNLGAQGITHQRRMEHIRKQQQFQTTGR